MKKQRARPTPQTQGGRVGAKISDQLVHRIPNRWIRNGKQLRHLRRQTFLVVSFFFDQI